MHWAMYIFLYNNIIFPFLKKELYKFKKYFGNISILIGLNHYFSHYLCAYFTHFLPHCIFKAHPQHVNKIKTCLFFWGKETIFTKPPNTARGEGIAQYTLLPVFFLLTILLPRKFCLPQKQNNALPYLSVTNTQQQAQIPSHLLFWPGGPQRQSEQAWASALELFWPSISFCKRSRGFQTEQNWISASPFPGCVIAFCHLEPKPVFSYVKRCQGQTTICSILGRIGDNIQKVAAYSICSLNDWFYFHLQLGKVAIKAWAKDTPLPRSRRWPYGSLFTLAQESMLISNCYLFPSLGRLQARKEET